MFANTQMRFINMHMLGDKFVTSFYETGDDPLHTYLKWQVKGHTLEPMETVVDWIENGILPKHTER